jgi:regulator of protease activity HflC (stomatin/prohibitin superfamily)
MLLEILILLVILAICVHYLVTPVVIPSGYVAFVSYFGKLERQLNPGLHFIPVTHSLMRLKIPHKSGSNATSFSHEYLIPTVPTELDLPPVSEFTKDNVKIALDATLWWSLRCIKKGESQLTEELFSHGIEPVSHIMEMYKQQVADVIKDTDVVSLRTTGLGIIGKKICEGFRKSHPIEVTDVIIQNIKIPQDVEAAFSKAASKYHDVQAANNVAKMEVDCEVMMRLARVEKEKTQGALLIEKAKADAAAMDELTTAEATKILAKRKAEAAGIAAVEVEDLKWLRDTVKILSEAGVEQRLWPLIIEARSKRMLYENSTGSRMAFVNPATPTGDLLGAMMIHADAAKQ